METKIFITILTWVGFSSWVCGIMLNIGTWKANVLFVFGAAFMALKFIRILAKTWQAYKREEIELKILKKKLEE